MSFVRVISLLLMGALVAPAFADEPTSKTDEGTIAVLGQGEVEERPGVARIQVVHETRADSLAEAQGQGEAASSADAAEVRKLRDKSLKVVSHSFSVHENRPQVAAGAPPAKLEWLAVNSYGLRLESMEQLDAVLTELIGAGLRVSRLSYDSKNPRATLLEARKRAAEDALSQAKAYAEALGVELGAIASVSDGEAHPADVNADLPTKKAGAGMRIEIPDAIAFGASVQIVWRIAHPPEKR